ncbi:hypothetical protein NQ315_001130 [Exocentrus adspersus]|uniref:Uncharacterized protein n=1 Tax=Exocentrus adspersus TaxID=1586481 RepID=A0AAV8WFV5_9CUCU|nr:hypothetical protein NQ315_001130 [Exocentrus adspersus]
MQILPIVVVASPTKDLVLGRTYVVPAETPVETFNLLRLSNDSGISVQQILYVILTPIQQVIGSVLSLICTLIAPVTTTVETLRAVILVNVIAVLQIVVPILSIIAPQYGIVVQIGQILLNAGNQLLYNGTVAVQTYGCSTIDAVNDAITSIVDAIVGIF